MSYHIIISKIEENDQVKAEEAVKVLLRIITNILDNPNNEKVRKLRKENPLIANKLLSIKGGLEFLKFIGFEPQNDLLILPNSQSLQHLQQVKNSLSVWRYPQKQEEIIRKIILPPITHHFTNPFLKRIESYSHMVVAYEDKNLQERALKLIPVRELEEKAQKNLRNIQKSIKKDKLEDPEISLQDAMILELLDWFKHEFFSWVDSPECEQCGSQTKMSHMSNNPNDLLYTDRVEIHVCEQCKSLTKFARYTDLNILLETRRGRCGEWANMFTLLCRALSWDARFVVDEGDHVWTEVYSITQRRWLHCDPCENICDTPLVYEAGWKKKISYVMAYNAEEIQDVTWRYSSHHKEVLKRRNHCSEAELLKAILTLRKEKESKLSASRKHYLTRRLLAELVELMVEVKPNNKDIKGRISGSAAWRSMRGEIQIDSNYTFELTDSSSIQYSAALDRYHITNLRAQTTSVVENWFKGCFFTERMFRKTEQDWKKVYLARSENDINGVIVWKFSIVSDKVVDKVSLKFNYELFENGSVKVTLAGENRIIELGEKGLDTGELRGVREFTLTAVLSGGKGDNAWQHAQLFRQNVDCKAFPFIIVITCRDN